MKIYIVSLLLTVNFLSASADDLVVVTNKTAYVPGEQVHFDVIRKYDSASFNTVQPYLVSIDLVDPIGGIIATQTLYKNKGEELFFNLSEALPTGVYRVIANTKGCKQVVRRIHVYTKENHELKEEKKAHTIELVAKGDQFIKNIQATLIFRVLDQEGAGLEMTGTFFNSSDSVISYLKTDANGLVDLTFVPIDSIYKIAFEGMSKTISPKIATTFSTQFNHTGDSLEVTIIGSTKQLDITLDNQPLESHWSTVQKKDTLQFLCSTNVLPYGTHRFQVIENQKEIQSWMFFLKPMAELILKENTIAPKTNIEWEVNTSRVDGFVFSVLGNNDLLADSFDYYESLYLDQYDLNIQWVENRNFDTYLTYFKNNLKSKVNSPRLDFQLKSGILRSREDTPSGVLSFMPLNTLEPIEIRGEYVDGIHDFQSEIENAPSSVFVYQLSNFLLPLKPLDLTDSIEFKYPPINVNLKVDRRINDLVSNYLDILSIEESYREIPTDLIRTPNADFVYELKDYDVPDTMEEMINQIVKYVVIKKQGGSPYLSLYRYMTMYKFEGSPLILMDDIPSFDTRLLLNIDPKSIEKVELRNSIASSVTYGNLGMNGVIAFYFKKKTDNPLLETIKDMPLLEKRGNLTEPSIPLSYAPDFRNQLYWNSDFSNNKEYFKVRTSSSDLKKLYTLKGHMFMQDGSVIKLTSQLIVK